MEFVKGTLDIIVEYLATSINVLCIILMFIVTLRSIYLQITCKYDEAKEKLVEGIDIALTFKLAGETMEIIVARELKALYVVGVVLVLKVIIAVLLHYEEKWDREKKRK